MKKLGARIKRRREKLKMQLNDLAKQVGISASALSQIENTKVSPSIFTLKSIADKLHTTVGELIGENEVLSSNPMLRFDERHFVEKCAGGASLYMLQNHEDKKQMNAFLLELPPLSDAQGVMQAQDCAVYFFVLKGGVTMQLDGATYSLSEKDSFYFKANKPHVLKNDSKNDSELIWVVAPEYR